MDSKDLSVELKRDMPSYMVLKGTYGEKIHRTFRMSRQGVRWRFQRVLGDMYVSAFETILFIEKIFGSQLREYAIRISKERYVILGLMGAMVTIIVHGLVDVPYFKNDLSVLFWILIAMLSLISLRSKLLKNN